MKEMPGAITSPPQNTRTTLLPGTGLTNTRHGTWASTTRSPRIPKERTNFPTETSKMFTGAEFWRRKAGRRNTNTTTSQGLSRTCTGWSRRKSIREVVRLPTADGSLRSADCLWLDGAFRGADVLPFAGYAAKRELLVKLWRGLCPVGAKVLLDPSLSRVHRPAKRGAAVYGVFNFQTRSSLDQQSNHPVVTG